ncbi:MAG: hypothetical protein ACREIW_08380 [Chthoniobacterales bacterium]
MTDSSGAFEFIDPPVGANTLFLECPGTTEVPSPTMTRGLDMRVVRLFPGGNEPLNLTPPNIAPCWERHRIFPLTSGWLTSAEAVNAAAPSGDERGIFSTFFAYLKRNGHTVTAIQSRTITRCRFNRKCGGVQLPAAVHDREIDSSTVSDFLKRTSSNEPLNPNLALSLGLHMITDDEMRFLAEQNDWRGGRRYDAREDSTWFWSALGKVKPKGDEVASVTRAGFNRKHTEALVEVWSSSRKADYGDASTMFQFRRTAAGWIVANADVGRGVTTGAWEANACVPTALHGQRATQLDIDRINGWFDFWLVEKAYADTLRTRRIRIGRDMPPRWPPPGKIVKNPPAKLPRSYEVTDRFGNVDVRATNELSIAVIPRNIIRDPDIMQLDGEYTNLKILRVTADGFYGTAISGAFGDSGFGYFCARNVTR